MVVFGTIPGSFPGNKWGLSAEFGDKALVITRGDFLLFALSS